MTAFQFPIALEEKKKKTLPLGSFKAGSTWTNNGCCVLIQNLVRFNVIGTLQIRNF